MPDLASVTDRAAVTELAAVTEPAGSGRITPVIGRTYALGGAPPRPYATSSGATRPARRSSPCGEPVRAHGRRTPNGERRTALRHHLDTVR